jgi:hypothetical protein
LTPEAIHSADVLSGGYKADYCGFYMVERIWEIHDKYPEIFTNPWIPFEKSRSRVNIVGNTATIQYYDETKSNEWIVEITLWKVNDQWIINGTLNNGA